MLAPRLLSLLVRPALAISIGVLCAGMTACGSNGSDSTTATAAAAATDVVSGSETAAAQATEASYPGDVIDGIEKFAVAAGPSHVETPVSYPQSPPVGGDHHPAWQNCGSYPDPVANEHAVHSLEHGAVWIAYQPELTAGDVAALRSFAVNQTHVLVSPYPGLSSKVVVSAWGRQLRVDSATDERIGEFVVAFQNGPQTLEPGAPCTGAVGTPL